MLDNKATIDAHLARLKKLNHSCFKELPRPYYDTVCLHWFQVIGPDKTEEYGVTAWRRLGARGIAGQLSGMFYRWSRMISKGRYLDHPPMYNAVVDIFGYAMLLHCVLDLDEVSWDNSLIVPRIDHEEILNRLWFGNDPLGAEVVALRMAYNVYRAANG